MPGSFSRASLSWLLLALLTTMFAPLVLTADALPPARSQKQPPVIDTPVVDPDFIYTQLAYMATHFLKREAGYDDNLPPTVNGHGEFADYWTQKMLSLLGNYGARARRDAFSIKGWQGRPPTTPAFNIEITVPGLVHPEQVVVIGCHYDGMAFSTQSANDDASGCAIELGIAQAMSQFWSKQHVYPARTLRFVIFDAEESGLFGSYHYVNETTNGDLSNIVAMFNEEQNGINYPLRYLGNASNSLTPYYIDMSPLINSALYPEQSKLTAQQRANIVQFRQLMQQAVVASFEKFRELGDQMLTYHGAQNQEVWQPIFTPDQLSNIHLEDDTLGASDQMPFTLAGLPCATLVGNSTYYDPDAPAGSYPYDQPDDTIQLMNTFADGRASQSQALTLALGLPGMITSWMLSQSSILGQAPGDGKPLAALNSIGKAQPGQAIHFAADAAYDPAQRNATLNYSWNFGDGSRASGQAVSHTYARSGSYTLSLSVTSSSGETRVITRQLAVGQSASYANPYSGYDSNGMPPGNPRVTLPRATNGPGDRVETGTKTVAPGALPPSEGGSVSPPGGLPLVGWLLILAGIVFIGGVIVVILRWIWRA